MEKTSKIKSCRFVSEWTGQNGVVYYHEIELDNGDKGQIGTKERMPDVYKSYPEKVYWLQRERVGMNTCGYPDCDKLTEGNTEFCATHNREARRREKLGFAPFYKRKPPKGSAYIKKANRWKNGKKCALKDYSKCVGMLTVHHKRGRIGDLLMNEKYWLCVCIGHHRYIETHPEESYKNGWSELRLANEPHEI